jgi:hypothetical protein
VRLAGIFALALACARSEGPPPCGSLERKTQALIPGPGRPGHDAELAAKADRHDRMFAAVHSRATGLDADFSFDPGTDRAVFTTFLSGEGTDFEAVTGVPIEALGRWETSVGLYGGAGIAADAYRYGALRDAGESCAEVDAARAQLVRAMEGLDVAARIDGVPGVMARGILRTDLPNAGFEVVPLFDETGMPLPAEKNNGAWRADQTGRYGTHVWVDSLSRDMLVGWAAAFGAIAEVARDDDSLPEELLDRIREDARDMARALMKVGESGYDLEIPDADGRLTLHAYLNENTVDRLYVDGARNGFHAVMALGIIGALAAAAEDPEIDAYLHQDLIDRRKLAQIADDDMLVVHLGVGSNFSNYNMAFAGMFLAQRYVDDPKANVWIEKANREELYDKPGAPPERQPKILKQSFFDLTYAAGTAGAKRGIPGASPDPAAIENALDTLRRYPDAPYFDDAVENCDAVELASKACVLLDGTAVTVLGEVGWKGTLVSLELVPMNVRPPSNYHWRSDPHQLNGGGGGNRLLPAVDFRLAYWTGRFIRITP